MVSPAKAPLPLLLNPAAGRRRRGTAADIERVFREAGIPTAFREVAPDELGSHVAREAQRGTPVVAVAGGDGSMRAAAEALLGRATVLAPIPTGTLNHFARRIGIVSVDDAVRAVARGRVAEVSVGVVAERVFLNPATCGAYAAIVRGRERLRPYLGKWLAALAAALPVLVATPRVDVVITTEETVRRERIRLVWAGVGRGSFPFPHRADERLHARVLETVVLRSGVDLLRLLAESRTIPGLQREWADVLRPSGLTLGAPHPMDVTLDGEPMTLDPPLAFSIRPRALRVLVGVGNVELRM